MTCREKHSPQMHTDIYSIIYGFSKEKRPLGRPRRRWMGNIKLDLREVGYEAGDRIDFAQDGVQ